MRREAVPVEGNGKRKKRDIIRDPAGGKASEYGKYQEDLLYPLGNLSVSHKEIIGGRMAPGNEVELR